MASSDEWMLVGRVASPFGVRGEFRVDLLTDFPRRFKKLRRVYVGKDRREFGVESVRQHADQILLKLEGVDSPESVRALAQPEIFVPRREAVRLPRGHFFLDDIPGMAVRTTDGRRLGEVTDVLATGSNEVFVVGKGRNEILIPVIKDAIHAMDLEKREVVVEPWVLDVQE